MIHGLACSIKFWMHAGRWEITREGGRIREKRTFQLPKCIHTATQKNRFWSSLEIPVLHRKIARFRFHYRYRYREYVRFYV